MEINILIHHRELNRPTSTGRLINRIIPNSRLHPFRPDQAFKSEGLFDPQRPLWILHPLGNPLPSPTPVLPAGLQVMLLDGSWREVGRMMRTVESLGQKISLPMTGPSRYRLRTQQGSGYSTVEALLFLLQALNLHEEHAQLRLQFELHVFAGLRARGDRKSAEEYLAESPIRDQFPALLKKLRHSRLDSTR